MVPFMPILKRWDDWPRCCFLLFLLVFFRLTTIVSAQTPQAGAVSVRANFADWSLRCETGAAGGRETCALVQTLMDEKRPDMVLSVLVVRTSDTPKTLSLRVITPLNVNLVRRLGLKIDALDMGRAAYSRCERFGCLAEVQFDDTLLTQFKTGKMAIFSYYVTGKDGGEAKDGLGFPLSLVGFDEGIQALLQ